MSRGVEERNPVKVAHNVSVIMPAYNESYNVRNALSSVSKLMNLGSLSYEIVLVDDGSVDDTRQTAVKATFDYPAKIVGYKKNMGKGNALKYGASFADGDFIFFLDSDLEINQTAMRQFMNSSQNGDILIASKRHPESKVFQPFMRKILSISFHNIVRLLTGITVSDTQTGLKAFRRESLDRILPLLSVKRYAFDVEVLVVAQLLGMHVVEMPVNIRMNARFRLKDVFRMAIDLLGIAYRLRIIHWCQRNLNNRHANYVSHIKW